jgi:hypothetical protein
VRPLLAEIGRIYVPFLLANAAAVGEGRETVECEFDGRAWTQSPFKYQAKCLGWLRDGYAALDAGDRAWIDETFAGTGCEALFVSALTSEIFENSRRDHAAIAVSSSTDAAKAACVVVTNRRPRGVSW